jgi:hypothetical protein
MNHQLVGGIISLTLAFGFSFVPQTFAHEDPGYSAEESGALREDPFLTPELAKEMEIMLWFTNYC